MSKIRDRLAEHSILEFVDNGIILSDKTGTKDNQAESCTFTYDKSVYTDKQKLLDFISTMWDDSQTAGCW